jgi:predicted nucleotidyltransferase
LKEWVKLADTARLIIPDVTDTLLSDIVSKIVKHFHPDKVILFGSRAWGEPTGERDLDILVVMDIDGSPIRKAAEISQIARPRFLPMDIIVRTPNEIEHRVEIGDPFIKRIMNHGKVLYE